MQERVFLLTSYAHFSCGILQCPQPFTRILCCRRCGGERGGDGAAVPAESGVHRHPGGSGAAAAAVWRAFRGPSRGRPVPPQPFNMPLVQGFDIFQIRQDHASLAWHVLITTSEQPLQPYAAFRKSCQGSAKQQFESIIALRLKNA